MAGTRKKLRAFAAIGALAVVVGFAVAVLGERGTRQRTIPIENVEVSADRRHIKVLFVALREAESPAPEDQQCSGTYRANHHFRGRELVITIEEASSEPGSCNDVGYFRSVDIDLASPFEGTIVDGTSGREVPIASR